MRNNIFISYRRADTELVTRKLYNDLKLRYGEDHIYLDIIGDKIGFDFGQRISNAMNDSAVILVIIGQKWAQSFRERRSDHDWVLFEVSHALSIDSAWRVIPVLVDATMPPADQLPSPVTEITRDTISATITYAL